jgi:hypothetical protein
MTDHLTTLLSREAESLDVPAAPAADILGAGRRLRRRRTRTIWGAAVAVAVVAGGSVFVGTLGDRHGATPVTPPPPPMQVGWAAGNTVYVGTGGHPAQMPEVAQTLYYTSAGVLVRTNKDGSSDGGAPFHFQLVSADGASTKLGVTLGDVVPSTDPTEPYLAWATMTSGKIQVVVHDVTTDQDVATVDVPGTFDWGGWEAPPVALSGDQVYVGTNDRTAVVNWRTGETTTTDVLPGNEVPEVSGGHTIVVSGQGRYDAQAEVVDATNGRHLVDLGRFDQVRLSPDGRFAAVLPTFARNTRNPVRTFYVFDADTDLLTSLPIWAGDWGWTSDGSVVQVKGDRLRVCSPTTATCRVTTAPRLGAHDFVRYAGTSFES